MFELLTATYAADEFDLRQHWEKTCLAAWKAPEYRILREVANTDFLQAVTLIATSARRRVAASQGEEDERLPRIGCKRADMLNLSLAEYQRFAPMIVEAMKSAAKFLHRQYLYDTKFLPYGTQLIPLAAILATLGKDSQPAGTQEKLAQWYWCGVFGELYGGTTETRFSRDLPDVVGWIGDSGVEPRTVTEAQFTPGRLLTLRTRGSAAYKGIYATADERRSPRLAYGRRSDDHDFFEEAIDIHHIFPKAWCEENNIEPHTLTRSSIRLLSPLVPIGLSAGGLHLITYRASRTARRSDQDTVAKHILTHLVRPDLLEQNAFDSFFATRKRALLDKIGAAMGKSIEDSDLLDTEHSETLDVQDDTEDL